MADDGLTGPELWEYDGVSVSQVTDINSGYGGSIPMPLREFNNSYYFSADHALFGNELWWLDPVSQLLRFTSITRQATTLPCSGPRWEE